MRKSCLVILMLLFGANLSVHAQQDTVNLTEDLVIHAETVQAISWMPAGQGFAYLSNKVAIVDLSSGFRVTMLPDTGVRMALAWHPDGQQLAVFGNPSNLWDMDEKAFSRIGIPPNSQFFGSNVIAWNASGDKILMFVWELQAEEVRLKVFNLQTGTIMVVGDPIQTATSTALWHQTDDRILVWDGDAFEVWELSGADAEQTQAFAIPELSLDAVTWHADNQFIAATGRDFSDIYLIVWDTVSEQIVSQVGGVSDVVTVMDWHPERNLLATGHNDGTLQLWSIDEGIHHAGTYSCSQDNDIPQINTVVWSPDGSQIACGSADGTLKIWNLN